MAKNKKATIFMTFVSISILVALLFFYSNYSPDKMPVQKGLGEEQLEILKTYQQAEKAMLYIDLAAKHSADKTIEELNKEITQDSTKKDIYDLFSNKFNEYMNEYIEKYNDKELEKQGEIIIPKDNYDLLFKENMLIGIATQNIKINKENINYSVKPSFKIKLDYDIFGGEIGSIEEWEELPNDQVELKIRAAASKYNIPQHIALGVAMQESSMNHYNEDGTVKSRVVEDEDGNTQEVIGIMQVALDKNSDYCSACDMDKQDLKDINKNIDCGMKILRDKYNLFCDSDDNALMRGFIGISEYELKIGEWCKINEHLEKYLEYDKDCDKMAIRAYNGLGCSENADVIYVERVLAHAAEYT
jgi:hypothetical protein